MDYSKIQTDIGKNSLSTKSNVLTVDFKPNSIKFNLMEILPSNSILKSYNLNLFDPSKSNRIVSIGLSVNTNKFLDDVYPELKFRGNVLYEVDNKTYEIQIDTLLRAGEKNEIINDVKHLSESNFESDEDVINYLIKEINSLKNRIYALELNIT